MNTQIKGDDLTSAQHIQDAIKHGNDVVLWVVESILSKPTSEKRADTMAKFLTVCRVCMYVCMYVCVCETLFLIFLS